MDSWHIRAAITSLTPRVLLKNLHRLREVARACNEFQAQRVRDNQARFGAFALLPLPDVDGALEEIAYALDVLRLDGIGLFSSVNDRYLGDPLFDPVFDELNRRNAVVFIHPTHCEAAEHTACARRRSSSNTSSIPPALLSTSSTPALSSAVRIFVLSSLTAAAPCPFSRKESR